MLQRYLVYVLVLGAVGFLIYKYFIPKKKKNGSDKNCGCGK